MVLIVDSTPIASVNLQNLLNAPGILLAAADFRSKSSGAEDFSRTKSAYVLQGELARIDTRVDPDVLLSSSQATTCVIAVAICQESQTACICHMDQVTEGPQHLEQWLKGMRKPDIYLVGGYKVQFQLANAPAVGQFRCVELGDRIEEHGQWNRYQK